MSVPCVEPAFSSGLGSSGRHVQTPLRQLGGIAGPSAPTSNWELSTAWPSSCQGPGRWVEWEGGNASPLAHMGSFHRCLCERPSSVCVNLQYNTMCMCTQNPSMRDPPVSVQNLPVCVQDPPVYAQGPPMYVCVCNCERHPPIRGRVSNFFFPSPSWLVLQCRREEEKRL